MKTPSRPDLHSIFNTRQRKPRSTPAKSNVKAKQQPAIVPGDLLQLYAAKFDTDHISVGQHIDDHVELLSVKRPRPSENQVERMTKRRVDRQELGSSLSSCKSHVTTMSPENTVSSFEHIVSSPDVPPLEHTDVVPVEISEPSNRINLKTAPVHKPTRMTRAQLLMKSALVSDRSPKFQDALRSTFGNSQSRSLEPETIEKSSIITTAETQTNDWVATAKRLITPELLLPVRLQNLKDVFKAVETTMNVHKARRRISVPSPELASGVQSIIKKTFTKSYLAQIVHIFPQGYSLHNRAIRNSESGRNENVIMVTMVELPGSSGLNQLQRNQHRLDNFHDCLLKFVFGFYLQWIKKKFPDQLNEIEASGLYTLTSWHPSFPLERCPSVPLCKLPSPPSSATSKELARLVGGGDAEREAAAEVESKIKASPAEEINTTDIPEGLQGLPLMLVQKVRLKEAAARKVAEEIGTKRQIQTDIDLDSLPDFVILVYGMFSALGKPSMLFSALVSQLKFKLKQQFVSEGSILNRINLLLELLPNFCQKVIDGRIQAFRIDLTANVAHLRAELRYKIKQKRTSGNVRNTIS